MKTKIIWLTLLGLFALSGCSLIKTHDHSEVFRNFDKKFSKPTFKEPRDNTEVRF